MSPEVTVSISKSLLDKPLHLITEDDISQLTREDCRRYLKQKGMRRPSWNKSQAIQQVISLKALLETTPYGLKLYGPRADANVQKKNTNSGFCESAEKAVPDGRKQQDKPDLSSNTTVPPVIPVVECPPSRNIGSVDRQMTIFYSGKVNVYDDVPADKAQTIIRLASSPLLLPSHSESNATGAARHSVYCLLAANTKLSPESDMVPLEKVSKVSQMHVEESNIVYENNLEVAEGPTGRKASVQRYLEKRKDRCCNN